MSLVGGSAVSQTKMSLDIRVTSYWARWRLNSSAYWLFTRLFRNKIKKTSKFRITGLCEENSPVTGEFPAQKPSNADNVSIWWRNHEGPVYLHGCSRKCLSVSVQWIQIYYIIRHLVAVERKGLISLAKLMNGYRLLKYLWRESKMSIYRLWYLKSKLVWKYFGDMILNMCPTGHIFAILCACLP